MNPIDDSLPSDAPIARDAEFDRLGHCTRKTSIFRELCKHYVACLSEQVFEEKKLSARWTESGGNCYQPATDEDLKYYSTLNRITT